MSTNVKGDESPKWDFELFKKNATNLTSSLAQVLESFFDKGEYEKDTEFIIAFEGIMTVLLLQVLTCCEFDLEETRKMLSGVFRKVLESVPHLKSHAMLGPLINDFFENPKEGDYDSTQ